LVSIARVFVALGIMACCDEADGLLTRIMPRGK
jgi:hypothetical protein